MRDFIIRVFINAIAILLTSMLLSQGITIRDDGFASLLVIGLVIALINAFIKPVVRFVSCLPMLLTFGLFVLVINGLLLMLADALLDTLTIHGFGWAVLAGIIMAIVSTILEAILLRLSR